MKAPRLAALLAPAAWLACDHGAPPPRDDAGESACAVTPNAATRLPGAGAPPRLAYAATGAVFDAVYLAPNAAGVPTPTVARVDAAVGALLAGPIALGAGPAQPPWIAPSLGDGAGSMVAWVGGATLYSARLDPSALRTTRGAVPVATATGDARLRALFGMPAGYAMLWNPDPTRLALDATDATGARIATHAIAPPDSPALLDATVLDAPAAGATSAALLLPAPTAGDALVLLDAAGERATASTPLPGTTSLASEVLVWTGSELRVVALRTGAGTGNTQLTLARFAANGSVVAPAVMLVGALPQAPGAAGGEVRALGAAWDGDALWIAWNDVALGAALGRVRADGAGVTDVRPLSVTGAALTVGWLALGGRAFAVGAVDAAGEPTVVTGTIACPH